MPKKHMSPARVIKKIVSPMVKCDDNDFENTEKMPLKSINTPVSDNDETSASEDKESSDFEEQIKPPPKKSKTLAKTAKLPTKSKKGPTIDCIVIEPHLPTHGNENSAAIASSTPVVTKPASSKPVECASTKSKPQTSVTSTAVASKNGLIASGNSATSASSASGDAGFKKTPFDAISHYLLSQNRPYSALQIWENLHKEIPKPKLEQVLTKLVEDGTVSQKTLTKSALFFATQSGITVPTEQLTEMDIHIEALQAELMEMRSVSKAKQLETNHCEASLSTPDAIQAVRQLEPQLSERQTKLKQLQNSENRVDVADMISIYRQYTKIIREWQSRRHSCLDMVELLMGDDCNSKTETWMNDHGIDTDVAVNQNLMEFQKYLKTEVTPRLDQLQKSAAKKVAM